MGYTTGKKEKIMRLMRDNHGVSYSLEHICELVLDGDSGKSTVYRIVSELVADGCLRRICDERTRRVTYQYMGSEECHNHLHLKCKGCGRLIHLDDKISRELEDSVRSVGGFSIDEGALLLGTCHDCSGGEA